MSNMKYIHLTEPRLGGDEVYTVFCELYFTQIRYPYSVAKMWFTYYMRLKLPITIQLPYMSLLSPLDGGDEVCILCAALRFSNFSHLFVEVLSLTLLILALKFLIFLLFLHVDYLNSTILVMLKYL